MSAREQQPARQQRPDWLRSRVVEQQKDPAASENASQKRGLGVHSGWQIGGGNMEAAQKMVQDMGGIQPGSADPKPCEKLA